MSDRAINLPDIKPCPFCGESVELSIVSYPAGFTRSVYCYGCGTYGPGGESDIETMKAWNEAKR